MIPLSVSKWHTRAYDNPKYSLSSIVDSRYQIHELLKLWRYELAQHYTRKSLDELHEVLMSLNLEGSQVVGINERMQSYAAGFSNTTELIESLEGDLLSFSETFCPYLTEKQYTRVRKQILSLERRTTNWSDEYHRLVESVKFSETYSWESLKSKSDGKRIYREANIVNCLLSKSLLRLAYRYSLPSMSKIIQAISKHSLGWKELRRFRFYLVDLERKFQKDPEYTRKVMFSPLIQFQEPEFLAFCGEEVHRALTKAAQDVPMIFNVLGTIPELDDAGSGEGRFLFSTKIIREDRYKRWEREFTSDICVIAFETQCLLNDIAYRLSKHFSCEVLNQFILYISVSCGDPYDVMMLNAYLRTARKKFESQLSYRVRLMYDPTFVVDDLKDHLRWFPCNKLDMHFQILSLWPWWARIDLGIRTLLYCLFVTLFKSYETTAEFLPVTLIAFLLINISLPEVWELVCTTYYLYATLPKRIFHAKSMRHKLARSAKGVFDVKCRWQEAQAKWQEVKSLSIAIVDGCRLSQRR